MRYYRQSIFVPVSSKLGSVWEFLIHNMLVDRHVEREDLISPLPFYVPYIRYIVCHIYAVQLSRCIQIKCPPALGILVADES